MPTFLPPQLNLLHDSLEALNNARKHSAASKVNIDIRFNYKPVQLIVCHDVIDFDIKESRNHAICKGHLNPFSAVPALVLIEKKYSLL